MLIAIRNTDNEATVQTKEESTAEFIERVCEVWQEELKDFNSYFTVFEAQKVEILITFPKPEISAHYG